MNAMAPQISGVSIVWSTVGSGRDQIKHQSSALLAFVRGIHRGPVNSPHKRPVTRKMFPFDDVIMFELNSPLGDIAVILKVWFSSSYYGIEAATLTSKLMTDECHTTSFMKNQHWSNDGTRPYTWANVDPDVYRHVGSLGHTEFNRPDNKKYSRSLLLKHYSTNTYRKHVKPVNQHCFCRWSGIIGTSTGTAMPKFGVPLVQNWHLNSALE